MWKFQIVAISLSLVWAYARAQSSELVDKLQDMIEIREKARRFNVDRDFYFDFTNDYVPSIVRSGLSETTGDVTVVIRFATMLNLARFDANAPFTATALGITTQIPRKSPREWTLRNKNVACIYASYRVMLGVIPQETERIRQMMEDLGLNPDDDREDYNTAVGIGNICGNNVVRDRLDDGVNQLGDEIGRTYNRQPYMDYTDYEPVNTAYKLKDPSRWQPAIVTEGDGKFFVQQFVTPHNGLVRPYTFKDVNQFEVGPHGRLLNSQYDLATYKESTDEVIKESARLNDERKLKSEFYEDKARSILGSIFFTVKRRNFGIDEFNTMELMSNMAIFDTMIIVWKEKRRWDAVRPFSAIRYLYGDQPLTAWGGPYNGTVHDIPANEWTSYLPVANHPEYPSASTGACVAHAETMKLFLGDDDLSWDVGFEAGSSRIEPGALPYRNVSYRIQTFSDFAFECGESRMWAGVHFQDAIDSIKPIARKIGQMAAKLVLKYANAEPALQPAHAGPVAHAPAHAHEPLRIQELPPNPFGFNYPTGYGGYGVTPAPVAPVSHHFEPPRSHSVAPTPAAVVPFRTPKTLSFSNHYSFALGKK